MQPARMQIQAVARFRCLAAECPDTCCKGWGMQVAPNTLEKYRHEAPALLDAVDVDGADAIMKRDPATDHCVKLDGGLCAIQRDYGEEFLGDACHLFPRITRALGGTVVTSSALSCPEMARLMLLEADGLPFAPQQPMRTPYLLHNYLPEGLSEEQALGIHQAMMDMATDEAHPAEWNVMRLSATARALAMQPVMAWPDAVDFYVSMADGRIPAAEPMVADPFNLLQALYGLLLASPSRPENLLKLIAQCAEQLGITFADNGAMTLASDAAVRAARMLARMKVQSLVLQPVFRRYVGAQLSQALFPFAGFGETLAERMTIIGVRLATVKLLLSTLMDLPQSGDVVAVIQALSRFMDHLADPALSLQIYRETGWAREPRMRALLGV